MNFFIFLSLPAFSLLRNQPKSYLFSIELKIFSIFLKLKWIFSNLFIEHKLYSACIFSLVGQGISFSLKSFWKPCFEIKLFVHQNIFSPAFTSDSLFESLPFQEIHYFLLSFYINHVRMKIWSSFSLFCFLNYWNLSSCWIFNLLISSMIFPYWSFS